MAREYAAAGLPVVFLEQDVYRPHGVRLDRFHDAWGSSACGVPWVIVDSGFGVTCGRETDYEVAYGRMIDEALERPALAEVEAWYERSDDDVIVRARVTNRTGGTLSFANWAVVNAIVWERAHVVHTDRIVRAASQAELTRDLPDDASETVSIVLADVPVVYWDRAEVLVIFDYRPEPTEARFESLQAAVALRGMPSPTPSPTARPTLPPDAPRAFLPITVRPRSSGE